LRVAECSLALNLPFPRTEGRYVGGSPLAPPAPVTANPGALATLRVFHDAGVGVDAARTAAALDSAHQGTRAGQTSTGRTPGCRIALPPGGAPLARLWRAQSEVRALARSAASDVLGPLRLEPGRPVEPRTEGLPFNRSELRLAPL
jgi:hypothetical protein